MITWCFRPSRGKWSTIRQVDSFWINCFHKNRRPNFALIMFIGIVDLVRDCHLASVQSLTYDTALSHIFEKLKIDCSTDLAVPLIDPISDKSLWKAKFTLHNGEWVRNNELPQGVQPAGVEDAPQALQALVAPPPPLQAFSFDPMMAYLDVKFASLLTYIDERFDSMNQRFQAIETYQHSMDTRLQDIEMRQNSMDITLNAFRTEWRGHQLGPQVVDEEGEEEDDEENNDDIP
ncbi:hypothetical protein V6N13_124844 [Hibiscus sabdariffa]